jgi:hypothetical protein
VQQLGEGLGLGQRFELSLEAEFLKGIKLLQAGTELGAKHL